MRVTCLPAEAADEVLVGGAAGRVAQHALLVLLARRHVDHRHLVRLAAATSDDAFQIKDCKTIEIFHVSHRTGHTTNSMKVALVLIFGHLTHLYRTSRRLTVTKSPHQHDTAKRR